MAAPRDAHTRKADTLAKLRARHADVWVASASIDGARPVAHLIPLSLAWIDERIVVAAPRRQQTARNIAEHGSVRLAVGPTRDVVIIDAVLERVIGVAEAPADFAERYAAQADWDPRTAGAEYAYLVLRPQRIQAWREENELAGRTLMRGGAWLI
ncbi:MAG: pyridoxamine 5'-phosphate oxidase family protein [Chloroflexi bacterium]|nr:pyridoxamine 5'-phosphate oxidase family protein [Chloroflexota bacterium]MBV9603117.1 pyridoxamine 5'-phosphate oxidase family protein [Chloroflexota bacterium]